MRLALSRTGMVNGIRSEYGYSDDSQRIDGFHQVNAVARGRHGRPCRVLELVIGSERVAQASPRCSPDGRPAQLAGPNVPRSG